MPPPILDTIARMGNSKIATDRQHRGWYDDRACRKIDAVLIDRLSHRRGIQRYSLCCGRLDQTECRYTGHRGQKYGFDSHKSPWPHKRSILIGWPQTILRVPEKRNINLEQQPFLRFRTGAQG